ncbi:hypothetical protein DFH06DRAFT_1316840 [Mycena polygramma]|nr:hypothetical protein DFH06DRAFT_1316840 [Mycena polygramma]
MAASGAVGPRGDTPELCVLRTLAGHESHGAYLAKPAPPRATRPPQNIIVVPSPLTTTSPFSTAWAPFHDVAVNSASAPHLGDAEPRSASAFFALYIALGGCLSFPPSLYSVRSVYAPVPPARRVLIGAWPHCTRGCWLSVPHSGPRLCPRIYHRGITQSAPIAHDSGTMLRDSPRTIEPELVSALPAQDVVSISAASRESHILCADAVDRSCLSFPRLPNVMVVVATLRGDGYSPTSRYGTRHRGPCVYRKTLLVHRPHGHASILGVWAPARGLACVITIALNLTPTGVTPICCALDIPFEPTQVLPHLPLPSPFPPALLESQSPPTWQLRAVASVGFFPLARLCE